MSGSKYVDGMLIVNKTYALAREDEPGALLPEVMKAWDSMVAAAEKDGIKLWIISGYRTYEAQEKMYLNFVEKLGKAKADACSARPGYSEHQTGLAFDVCENTKAFGSTPTGIWVAAHAAQFGFIIRYPQGKEEQTGYIYEPWHLRYLGVANAEKISKSGLCLEEYFGITSAYAAD